MNKIKIIITLVIVGILVSVSVGALTRTISDSSDNVMSFIRNSNGGIWEVTGANINLAINDVNETQNGTVSVSYTHLTLPTIYSV